MNLAEYSQKIIELAQKNKRLPHMICVILSVFMVWTLYSTVQIILEPWLASRQILLELKTQGTLQIPAPTDISTWHLMGEYRSDLADLPVTRLQLTLQGTEISLEKQQDSQAIILSPDQPAAVYHVGQTVPGGAIITKIERNRVILNHDGVLEQLPMPIPQLTKSSPQGLQLPIVQ